MSCFFPNDVLTLPFTGPALTLCYHSPSSALTLPQPYSGLLRPYLPWPCLTLPLVLTRLCLCLGSSEALPLPWSFCILSLALAHFCPCLEVGPAHSISCAWSSLSLTCHPLAVSLLYTGPILPWLCTTLFLPCSVLVLTFPWLWPYPSTVLTRHCHVPCPALPI